MKLFIFLCISIALSEYSNHLIVVVSFCLIRFSLRKKIFSNNQDTKGVYFDVALSPLENTPLPVNFPKFLNVVFYFKHSAAFKDSTLYYKMINCPRTLTFQILSLSLSLSLFNTHSEILSLRIENFFLSNIPYNDENVSLVRL
jgi:hypothetical protein